jgi:O-succinylbenzoic acid--CoA ligase
VDLGSPFPKWNPQAFAEAAENSKATLSALVPTQIFDLVRAGISAPGSLRAIVVGGGNLSEALYSEARKLGWPLLPSYGLTECSSQVATASLESLGSDFYPELKILSHVQACIVATKGGNGLLRIKSDALLSGYLLETSEGAVFEDPKQDGWFTTEDLALVYDGTLRVLGREGSFVKMGGESVDFARLERLFEEVRLETGFSGDALVMAVPDERLGYKTALIAAEERKFSEEELMRLVEGFDRKVLPVEKIRMVRRVARIPRSALGKTLKKLL